MLDLDLIISNGEGHNRVQHRQESNLRALETIDEMKKDFIRLCLHEDPDQRPTAQDLLKQPVLQEVSTALLHSVNEIAPLFCLGIQFEVFVYIRSKRIN